MQLHAQGIVLRDLVPGAEIKTKKQQVCRTGDFLVAEIDAKLGGFGIVPPELDDSIVSSHYFLYEVDETQLDLKYLGYFIRTPEFQDQVAAQGTTNYAAIRPQHVLEYVIPLPPLDEQRRIVAYIDLLVVRIAKARGLSQGALAEAQNLVLDASAAMYSNLAQNYRSVQLGTAFTYRNDLIRPSDGASGKLVFVGLQHVEPNTGIRIGEDILLAEELKGRKFRFSPGEIVYGYLRPYLNKVWIADRDGFCSVDQFVLRPKQQMIDTAYLAFFMRSRTFLETAIELTNNLQLPRLSSVLLSAMNIPLPPLAEQKNVVDHLYVLQKKLETVKQLQAESATELDALLPSLLDRAFRGEL